MVLKFNKPGAKPAPAAKPKAPPAPPQEEVQEEAPWEGEEQEAEEGAQEPEEEAAPPPPPPPKKTPPKTAQAPSQGSAKPGLSFLKRGAAAKEAMAREEKKEELRRNRIDRYWIPSGKTDGDVTFLDGNIVSGALDIPFYHEHNVNMNGHWRNWFVCTQDDEPCPICEGGLNAAYVGAMTVIDHSEYTNKSGVLVKDTVKLFVAKRDTIKLLQAIAVKRGGLRGCRFDVSRIGDKAPGCGSSFDFTHKLTDQQLAQTYKDKAKPIDYDKYLAEVYQPASELRKIGFGSMGHTIGNESAPDGKYDV